MRPLPDLADLESSPSVFNQGTDDWNSIFAPEFQGSASQQQEADQQSAAIFPAMDLLSKEIDAIGGLLDAATEVFGLLSGSLDLVDLTPEIQNFQGYDAALDASLSNPVFDFTEATTALLNDFAILANVIEVNLGNIFEALFRDISYTVDHLSFEVEQLMVWAFGTL